MKKDLNTVNKPQISSYTLSTQEADILSALNNHTFNNQRDLATYTGHALGMVNKSVRNLIDHSLVKVVNDSYGVSKIMLTRNAKEMLKLSRPKHAIILAAGFGMRMVPINLETPKALLSVNGERIIERIIKQLHGVGVSDIHVVVGFMKERFEYLIDKYCVDLIVNRDYAKNNNIHSLVLASRYLDNCYIIPSDVWCDQNPFSSTELYSWYMVSDEIDDESDVRVNRKNELVRVNASQPGNAMVGISYLTGTTASIVKRRIEEYTKNPHYDESFWEEALYGNKNDGQEPDRMIVKARVVHAANVVEINTYEQLRDLDDSSSELHSDAIDTIKNVFGVDDNDITNITVLKKGMTNRSFLFNVNNTKDTSLAGKYIMRIPGEGTDKLINRKHEADVYHAISGKGLCDDPVYINPDYGYKITKFLDGARNCDPTNDDDLIRAMDKLRSFHNMKLQVNHTYDIFGQINFYKSLWNGEPSMYDDHKKTTEHVFELKDYIDKQPHDWCLTHIDAVPDNFLFYKKNGSDKEGLQLTDWEYSGMQDPHVDIAMFCIYSLYDKEQVDHLIDIYFKETCSEPVRTKIYCYIAACGLLWSNWCEYKSHLGVEFGEYSLRQYRFAKDYYRYAKERI